MSFTESLTCMASFCSDMVSTNQYDVNFARDLLNKINTNDTYLKTNMKALISKLDSIENSSFSDKLYTLLRIILKKSHIILNTIFLKEDQFQICDNDNGKYDLIVQRPPLLLNKTTKILILCYEGFGCTDDDHSFIQKNQFHVFYRCNKNINFIMNQSLAQPTVYRNTNDNRPDPFIEEEFNLINSLILIPLYDKKPVINTIV